MAAVVESDAYQGAGYERSEQPGYGGGLPSGALVLKEFALQTLEAAIGVQKTVM
jgi:hypothetical protein